jgi:hypothetical protein
MLTLAFTPLGSATTCSDVKELYTDHSCCGAATKVLPDVDIAKCTTPADVVDIKSSSLSYANAAGRVGFNFATHYNDFNNEGHMYPVHGVGDLDKTRDLMAKFIKSAQGEKFGITDLGIDIKVTDTDLMNNNCYFDFHNIPTKMLDGSTKLPDGSRIESHISYFTGKEDNTNDPCRAKIDWISGMAKFIDNAACSEIPGFADLAVEGHPGFPTTLMSTRDTPFLRDDENLALAFFMDGKQARLTNGGRVSNWRYVVPLGMGRPLSWFVAQAYVECEDAEKTAGVGCVEHEATNGGPKLWVRPRTAAETEDPDTIASKPRIMKTVTEAVPINAAPRAAAFNQRYADKCVDFGDVVMKPEPDASGDAQVKLRLSDDAGELKIVNTTIATGEKYKDDKQMQFNEMLRAMKDGGLFATTNIYDTDALPDGVETVMNWFIARYLNKDTTYNISPKALVNKALLPPTYMWSPVCETGWLVVDQEEELVVPDDPLGEYFIGWTVETQPMFESEAHDSMIRTSTVSPEKLQQLVTKGYKLHQGPGMIFQTCGDFAHSGAQQPFLLEYNYPPARQTQKNEDEGAFASRKKSQLPTVHWRLDTPDVIKKSLDPGAFTKANVGAGQSMLASIGTKTHKDTPSRSKNFLGEKYQDLLANPDTIQGLCGRGPVHGEVYECVTSVSDPPIFTYGPDQQAPPTTGYTRS